MKKIFTFRAKSITVGTVSIEADTLEEAHTVAQKLLDADTIAINMEQGAGGVEVASIGHEEITPDDGTHCFTTPRENAKENAELLAEIVTE